MNQSNRKAFYYVKIALFSLILVFLFGWLFINAKNGRLSDSSDTLFYPKIDLNKDFPPEYSLRYPDDFFVVTNEKDRFVIAEERYKNQDVHNPTVGVRVYRDVIPHDMSLSYWVVNMTDYSDWEDIPESCTAFKSSVITEIGRDGFSNDGRDCWYHLVSDIEETTVGGMPAISFESQYMTGYSKQTLVKYESPKESDNEITLFEIYKSNTPLTDELDQTDKAYQTILKTLQIKD